ncbi:MAG TPA: TonB-dependent receptor [Flavobacteriaceae bacterium]|nr:TonB-dependent receptor [Flavobacteriaceae bacterium]
MKNIITIIVLMLTLLVNAQKMTISGNVLSQNEKEPLINVAIAFYDATTNEIITYAYSDFDGKYKATFKSKPFYIQADLLGFSKYKSSILKNLKSINLDIIMQQSSEQLNEVIVTSKKKIVRMQGDKMIINIASSGIGDGNNGIETLSQLPGMRLDKDDNILFRGDRNLQILIDGKPALLSGDDLKQYLKTLNGSNIKAVEIIANPSAKHDASGTGGVINILLKENIITGLTGSAFSSVGYAEFIKQSNGITLYNNTKKWNINAGIYTGYNEGVNHRNVVQFVDNPSLKKELNQKNDWFPTTKYYTAKLGTSYKLTKNASIGGTIKYNYTNRNEKTIGRTKEFYNDAYLKYTLLNETLQGNKKTVTSNVYYSFVADSLKTKIDAQVSFANYSNDVNRTAINQYLDADTNLPYINDNNVMNNNPTTFNILSSKFDLTHKLSENISVETGLKYSYVKNDYDLIFKEKNTQGNFVIDNLRSNHLLYKEGITAFYGIGNYNTDKWSLQAGLRTEYIDYKAKSITNNKINSGSNLSFFPSFSINRSMDKNQYKLSYSRRIQRPQYLDLNPFFKYVDTYNVEVGNPDLKPQFTNVFDFTWVHNRKTSISIYSKLTNDMIDYIFDYDQTSQITTLHKGNIAKVTFVGSSFNTSFDFVKWWNIQLNGDFSYNHLKSEIVNNSYDLEGSSWNASINQSFNLKNDWKISWNSYYSSAGDLGNAHYYASYDMSFGIKKRFFNKKLRINLKATNVLKQSKWHSKIKQDNVTTDWTNRWETRKFSLSLNYNFGNGKKKKVKAADLYDEQNRL